MRQRKQTNSVNWKFVLRFAFCLILVLFVFGRLFLFFFDTITGPMRSLSLYLKFQALDGWLVEEPYDIFPGKETVEASEDYSYLHKRLTSPTILYDNDVLTYLSCTYDQQTFSAERQRLASLCGELADGWELPAYVLSTRMPNGFNSYALLDEQADTIHYFSVQGTDMLRRYVQKTLYHELQAYFIEKNGN